MPGPIKILQEINKIITFTSTKYTSRVQITDTQLFIESQTKLVRIAGQYNQYYIPL